MHEEILAPLGATHADLLVLGTHGRSGCQRRFLGSVTEKVIRKAPCPTLVVSPLGSPSFWATAGSRRYCSTC